MLRDLGELRPLHIDALTEVGNIGSGNAATALATLLNSFVDIAIPTTAVLGYEQAVEALGGPAADAIGVSLDICGDLNGMILHILHPDFASKVVNTFYPSDIKSLDDITEMDLSVLSEVGNITSAAYVNALANMTELFIDIKPPITICDTISNILGKAMQEMPQLGDRIIFIDEKLTISDSEINSKLILMLEIESLNKLFGHLGVPY